MKQQQQSTLETRISAALGNGTAIDDDNLLQDVEWAIEQSARIAEQERNLSLDPTTSPRDAETAAAAAASVAELKRDRYKAALPRIQQKIAAAERTTAIDRWDHDADEVEAWAQAAEKKLATTYSKCAGEIVAALREATDANAEADKLNSAAPDDVHRRVDKVNLNHLKDLVLPDVEHRGRNLWPPRRTIALYADETAMDERDHADMIKAKQRALADAIENDRQRPQRTAERYAEMTRDQERRVNDEAAEAFRQSQQRRG
jgi:hypothetical protein